MIAIRESLPGLKPGMSAEVTIFADESAEPVLVVPVQAVLGTITMGAERKCFVVDAKGQTELRDIVVGMSNERLVEVKSGLNEGDRVVQNPQPLLKEDSELKAGKPRGKEQEGGPGGPAPGAFAPNRALEITPEYLDQVIGRVREMGYELISLEEAIRRLTSFPADTLKIERRGRLEPGYYADVVVFDPARIRDRATYAKPHQFSTGVRHVLVNGTPVLKNGRHTGATPGRVVRGPGWKPRDPP